jgi:hypothetical protein
MHGYQSSEEPILLDTLHKKQDNRIWGMPYKMEAWAESHFLLYPDSIRYCSAGLAKTIKLHAKASVKLVPNVNVSGTDMYGK